MSRSTARTALERALVALVPALVLLALACATAQAHVVFIHGKAYGVTPSPASAAAALASPAGRVAPLGPVSPGRRVRPLTVGGPQPPIEYHGGPLMLSSKLYLIFWDPEKRFTAGYTTPLVRYAEDLDADDSLTTDEFSVATQYANAKKEHITGSVTMEGEVTDETPYPALAENEGCTSAHKPCVTDKQIQTEILDQLKAEHWPTNSPKTPEAQYLLYTPAGVSVCIEAGSCTFSGEFEEGFCAYHSQVTEIGSSKEVATYSVLPDEPACDSGQAPAGVGGNKDADGVLDSEIHEIVESATDPEGTAYLDKNGYEVADKCTYPIVEEQPEIYGTPLGGSLTEDTAFNQLIDGHSYYTQQIWSQEPTQTPAPASETEPAGCAARIGPTPSFTAPAEGEAGHAIGFDGGASYDISAKITTYEWNFGDGSPVDTTSGPTPTHTYLTPGEYQVSLTAIDTNGKTDASTQTLPIKITGAAVGPPTATIEAPADNQTYTVGESIPTKFSCAEATGGPGIESCTDSNGSASPGKLDTSTAGPHSYTVTAISSDGQHGTATIDYAVSSPSSNPGGGNAGGSGTGSGANNTGSSGGNTGAGSSSSTTTPSSPGSTPGTGSSGAGGHVKPSSSAQKLARAIKACGKLKKGKRADCIAAAKRRFGSKKGKHKAKPATKQHSLWLSLDSWIG
jgi:PKD repeat protein